MSSKLFSIGGQPVSIKEKESQHMDKVRDNLFVGSWKSAVLSEVETYGITAVLDVALDTPYVQYHPHVTRQVKVNLGDDNHNPIYLKRVAVNALVMMLTEEETVLVHCVSGASRSVYVATMGLARFEGIPPLDAYRDIAAKRKQALFGPLFISHEEIWEQAKVEGIIT